MKKTITLTEDEWQTIIAQAAAYLSCREENTENDQILGRAIAKIILQYANEE